MQPTSQTAMLGFALNATLPTGQVGTLYSGSISATGGTSPYSFSVTAGALPSGLSLDTATGTISGTPSVAVSKTFWVRASDADGLSSRLHAQITIAAASTSNNVTPVSVAVSPASVSVSSGTTQQFSATVQGTSNTAVSWSSTAGTISTAGVFTAPAVSTNINVTIKATSAADSTQSASAQVTVLAPAAPQAVNVTISPASSSVDSGTSQQFTASVQGSSNTAVTWAASAGAISTGGLFTAPTVSSDTRVSVTATSVADPSQSATASVTVAAPTAPGTNPNAGCGVSANGSSAYDQSTCGNYPGAPYEDLTTASPTTPPSPVGSGALHTISSCTTIVPTDGDVWRFSTDVNDGVGGTNQKCIYFAGQNANNFVIDLAGHTLTGGIKCDQSAGGNDCSGITIVNGNVTCNIATGGSVSCITLTQGGVPSKSILLSHLTVKNLNSPTNPDGTYSGFQYVIYVMAGGTVNAGPVPAGSNQRTFNGAAVEEAHLTAVDASGYTGPNYSTQWCARCTAVFDAGNGGATFEAWNNLIPNNPYVDANQGIVFYHAGTSSAHNNYFPWVQYQGVGDTGRPILFDSAGKAFNQAGGEVSNNLIEAYNNRCVRTRQTNNVLVHDNRFEHVQSTTVDPCIMMGGNGDYSEKIDGNLVSRNTFTQAGGTSIEAAESYGLVADSNTFLCESNCSSGKLAAAWIAEGTNGLTFTINSASRTAACVVTLNLAYSPSSTSALNGAVYVNVTGRSDDFNVSGTAGNLLTTISGATVTYTQAGCIGANSGGAGGTFWMAQSRVDNFPANGAEIYVKNSIVDPQLTMSTPFVACGSSNPACQNNPQYTQIKWCNNAQDSTLLPALGGTGAVVTHVTPDSLCP